jgi:hypothetical protein
MTATAHALVAGAIASRFPDPVVASALAFTAHYAMDSIPHWDIGTNWRDRPRSQTGALALIETTVGIVLAVVLFSSRAPSVTLYAAIVFSLLPDWLEVPYYVLFAKQDKKHPDRKAGTLEKFTYRIYKTENFFHTKANFPIGIFTQIATVLFFFLLLGR